MLSPEETSSPRRAGSFSPKQFEGPDELEASLGEPGSKKMLEMIPFAPPLVYFSHP